MINNILLFIFLKIAIVWLILHILIIYISYVDKNKKRFLQENHKKDLYFLKKYLDDFYVKNKIVTFICSGLYIFCLFLIFVLFRYFSLQNIVFLSRNTHIINSLLQVILGYFLIIITLIMYRSLINILFKKEINKLYLYLSDLEWFEKITDVCKFKISEYIFGSLYLLTFRIATLTYRENMYPLGFTIDYIMNNEDHYVIYNKYIIRLANKSLFLARNHILIRKLFRLLAYIFRFCYKHVDNLFKPFPYFVLTFILLIDIYNVQLKNIYFALFIIMFIKMKRDFTKFLSDRNSSFDEKLYNYFYKNDISYKIQRISMFSHEIDRTQFFESRQNKALFQSIFLKEIIVYVGTDFCEPIGKNFSAIAKRELNRISGVYRRFFIICLYIILIYLFLWKNNGLLITDFGLYFFISVLCFMVFLHYKTYYVLVFEEMHVLEEYKYNIIYNIFFWLLALLQGYFFWLLIFQEKLIFMDTEILLQMPFDLFKVVKIHTVEEKTIYLYEYLDFYISLINTQTTTFDLDYLRYILRKIDFSALLTEKISLKDIQVYIKLILGNYILCEIFNKEMIHSLNNYYFLEAQSHYLNKIFSYFFMTTMVILSIKYITTLWMVYKSINTREGVFLLVNSIYKTQIYRKYTSQTLYDLIEKLAYYIYK